MDSSEFRRFLGTPWYSWNAAKLRGAHEIPRILSDSMDSMELHGITWIPWNSVKSMEFSGSHGIHEYLGISMDPVELPAGSQPFFLLVKPVGLVELVRFLFLAR